MFLKQFYSVFSLILYFISCLLLSAFVFGFGCNSYLTIHCIRYFSSVLILKFNYCTQIPVVMAKLFFCNLTCTLSIATVLRIFDFFTFITLQPHCVQYNHILYIVHNSTSFQYTSKQLLLLMEICFIWYCLFVLCLVLLYVVVLYSYLTHFIIYFSCFTHVFKSHIIDMLLVILAFTYSLIQL